MIQFENMPASIAKLPRDDRGFPVPWFVAWPDGKPDFRCMDGGKFRQAVKEKCCWVCGEPLDLKQHVFVLGPMCSINRVTSEPPSHSACAEFAAVNCPFLNSPKKKYREGDMPEDAKHPAGMFLTRNPGVCCLWFCRGYKIFDAGNGYLFRIPFPAKVRWFAEGRKATRAEIMESINTGLPTLQDAAKLDGDEAIAELRRATAQALKLVPAA